jgi:Holliday junction resolvase-like predicted endonuclease
MLSERELLMSLLKLTKDGPVLAECVKKDAKTTWSIARKLLEKLQKEEMVYLKQDTVEADSCGRLKLAVKAISIGADVEHVSNMLRWQEFEDLAAIALERNGYTAAKNVRFKHAGRKWEIDTIGCKKPLVISMDCKHWRQGIAPSALTRIAEAQVERTRALVESLPNISLEFECARWDKVRLVPVVLVLVQGSFKFCDEVPIVPVLQLQDFLSQLPVYIESLKYFVRDFNQLRHDF